MRLGEEPPQRPRELSSVHLLHAFRRRLLAQNLSVRALFPCVELVIPQSLFFTVSVSQHSWCSEAWIDVTGGSRKQQTDYCSLLLICEIKELSTVPLEKRIPANKTAQVRRVNKSSALAISDMSHAESARYRCRQSKLRQTWKLEHELSEHGCWGGYFSSGTSTPPSPHSSWYKSFSE